jgi:hypothetical protein
MSDDVLPGSEAPKPICRSWWAFRFSAEGDLRYNCGVGTTNTLISAAQHRFLELRVRLDADRYLAVAYQRSRKAPDE